MKKQKLFILIALAIVVFGTKLCYDKVTFPKLKKEVIIYDEECTVLFHQAMLIDDILDYERSKIYIDTFGYNKEERYRYLDQAIKQLGSLDSIVIKPIYWHRGIFGGKRNFVSSATTVWRNGDAFVALFISVDSATFDGHDEIKVSMSPRQSYGYGGSARAYLNEVIMEVIQNQLVASQQRLIKSTVTVSIQGNIPSMNSEYTVSEEESPDNIPLLSGIKKLAKEKTNYWYS